METKDCIHGHGPMLRVEVKKGTNTGRRLWRCRTCSNEANARWRAIPGNAEKHRAVSDAWKDRHPEKLHDWRLKKTYGLSLVEYNEILASQGGVCAICGTQSSGKRLSVDHCHETGQVRGILCQRCNLSLGHLETYLGPALAYLSGAREAPAG